MWAFLGEFGLWVLLACLVIGALVWFSPFLLLRWLIDRLSGRRGVVERALQEKVTEALNELRRLSATELLQHPEKGVEQKTTVAGRWVEFTWQVDPAPPWDQGTHTIVLWYSRYIFNLPFSPKLHSVDGFKITPEGTRVDLTPEELVAYD